MGNTLTLFELIEYKKAQDAMKEAEKQRTFLYIYSRSRKVIRRVISDVNKSGVEFETMEGVGVFVCHADFSVNYFVSDFIKYQPISCE